LAAHLGVAPAAITRIELGRVPLKYDLARDLFSYLGIDPEWAATGKGTPSGKVELPEAIALNTNGNATFSSVFFDELWPIFKDEKLEPELETVLRHTRGKVKAAQIEIWFRCVPSGYVRELDNGLEQFWKEFYSKLPPENPKMKLRRELEFASFLKDLERRLAKQKESGKNNELTDAASYGKISEVKAQLPNLLDRLNRATKETGKMSALAVFLGVPLASVSRWLSGKREPGGEITLRLLHWVEQQERKK